jgi:hypothetical protein
MSTIETETEIRPFTVEIPEQQLDDLRRRIEATRFPSKELVEDRSQGVQLATIQELATYWGTEYDWRKVEARLNALPQFTTDYRRSAGNLAISASLLAAGSFRVACALSCLLLVGAILATSSARCLPRSASSFRASFSGTMPLWIRARRSRVWVTTSVRDSCTSS